MKKWYYEINGDRRGPLSSQEVVALIEQGVILPDTPIFRDGMGSTVPARRLKGVRFPASITPKIPDADCTPASELRDSNLRGGATVRVSQYPNRTRVIGAAFALLLGFGGVAVPLAWPVLKSYSAAQSAAAFASSAQREARAVAEAPGIQQAVKNAWSDIGLDQTQNASHEQAQALLKRVSAERILIFKKVMEVNGLAIEAQFAADAASDCAQSDVTRDMWNKASAAQVLVRGGAFAVGANWSDDHSLESHLKTLTDRLEKLTSDADFQAFRAMRVTRDDALRSCALAFGAGLIACTVVTVGIWYWKRR